MVGDAGVRAYIYQPKLFVGMVLVLIFAEVLVCVIGLSVNDLGFVGIVWNDCFIDFEHESYCCKLLIQYIKNQLRFLESHWTLETCYLLTLF